MKKIMLSFLILARFFIHSQDCKFRIDTVFFPTANKNISCELMEAVTKNKSVFQLIKDPANKYYLRLIVTENLYFNKKDKLEIISGKRSFHVKDAVQLPYNKYKGYFLFEIYKNYISTLKDDGITGIVFGKAETDFTRSDCSAVKETAKCFYESIFSKKDKI